MSTNPIITLDQQLALRSTVTRLADESVGIYNSETIERFLQSSFDEFAGRATVTNIVPLLAERFTRQPAGTRAGRRPACRRQAGRALSLCSQRWPITDGSRFLQSLCGRPGDRVAGRLRARGGHQWSRGRFHAERGIDISTEFHKPWTAEVVRAADVVITMGCGEACPLFPGKKYDEWTLLDPEDWDAAHVRPIRDEIEQRVLGLLGELGVAVLT